MTGSIVFPSPASLLGLHLRPPSFLSCLSIESSIDSGSLLIISLPEISKVSRLGCISLFYLFFQFWKLCTLGPNAIMIYDASCGPSLCDGRWPRPRLSGHTSQATDLVTRTHSCSPVLPLLSPTFPIVWSPDLFSTFETRRSSLSPKSQTDDCAPTNVFLCPSSAKKDRVKEETRRVSRISRFRRRRFTCSAHTSRLVLSSRCTRSFLLPFSGSLPHTFTAHHQ